MTNTIRRPTHSNQLTEGRTPWLAVVPLKRHSARVPGKNVRMLRGHPLYYWTLRTLFDVKAIGTVVLDTDAEEIARMVSAEFPVDISMRPAALCGDFVPTNDLIAHVLSRYPAHQNILQTHVTNPLLTTETVSAAIATFELQSDCDSLFSVTRLQTRLYDAGGRALNHDPGRLMRTQDLEPVYEENSNLYLFTRESFAVCRSRIGARPYLYEMNRLEALDIDEEEDFQLAEALLATECCPVGVAAL